MRKILLLVCLAFTTISYSQVSNNSVISALKSANSAQFTAYFDSFIDLKLPAKDELKNMGKTQAAITVKSFFENNDIHGFELISQRELSGTTYIAGKLLGNNEKFNLTLMLKRKGDTLEIITVRIN